MRCKRIFFLIVALILMSFISVNAVEGSELIDNEGDILGSSLPFESYFSEAYSFGGTYNIKAAWKNKTTNSYENVNLYIVVYDSEGRLMDAKVETHSFESEETYEILWQFQCKVSVKIKLLTWDSNMKPYIPAAETALPEEILEFSQMNDKVTEYLLDADSTYTDTNSSTVSVMEQYQTSTGDKDRPVGIEITSSQAGTIYLLDESTGEVYEEAVVAGANLIRNSVPDRVYEYIIKNSSGEVIGHGRIKPTGKVRMLSFEFDVTNSRDVGGWDCDGGTVEYGKLFRSGGISYYYTYYGPRNAAVAAKLGICHHIDLRTDSEAKNITSSHLGASINYERITLDGYYKDIIDMDGTEYSKTKEILRKIIEAAINNEPVIYNCALGRDRTGTITFMLLAMLGVSRADLDKDYELSSFSSLEGWRDKVNPASRTNPDMTAMVEYLNTFNGDTLRDNVIDWFLKAGFSLDELNAFREAMCNGTPDELKAEDFIMP